MTQLAYKVERAAAEKTSSVATTMDKVTGPDERRSVRPRPGRSSSFSAGFFAGLVIACDLAAILLSGLVIQALYTGDLTQNLGRHVVAVTLFGVMTALVLNSTGLYRFAAIVEPKRQVFRIAVSVLGVFGLLGAMAVTFEVASRPPMKWALAWFGVTVGTVVLFRTMVSLFVRSLARKGTLGRQILIYGATDQARKLIERIERLGEPWNHIVGIFDDRVARVGPRVGRYPVMGDLDDLIAWGRENTLDEVLIALPWSAEARLLEITRSLAVLPANVRLCPELFHDEVLHGRASHHFGLPMWNAFEKPLEGWGAIQKRVFDIICATVVLTLATPLFVILALLIKLESRGSVLFRQKRYGFNNEVIEVYKFRSMRQELSDPEAKTLTQRNDPRVTRLGKFMRRTSLDELPQLINVLRGEMSIVGPRPHAPKTTAGGRLCEEVVDRYSRRHRVKPGITGWAQVNGYRGTMEDEHHLQKRLEHDLYYINNWSPWFDLKILAKTAWIVIGGRNSY